MQSLDSVVQETAEAYTDDHPPNPHTQRACGCHPPGKQLSEPDTENGGRMLQRLEDLGPKNKKS